PRSGLLPAQGGLEAPQLPPCIAGFKIHAAYGPTTDKY
ncbi:uncharacterized protein METZ01_LOCUS399703, partial [marine metagenome]